MAEDDTIDLDELDAGFVADEMVTSLSISEEQYVPDGEVEINADGDAVFTLVMGGQSFNVIVQKV